MKLTREFYRHPTLDVARALVGATLVRITADGYRLSGKIVETEAYLGPLDDAAHAFRGRTGRTEILFKDSGYAYVYLIYGMHCCLNFTVDRTDFPGCVLIRALEPLQGIERMKKNRGTEDLYRLCSGPGKLCQALEITRQDYGEDLCGERLFAEGESVPPEQIVATPRIHVDYAQNNRGCPYRFCLRNDPFVSVKPKGPSTQKLK